VISQPEYIARRLWHYRFDRSSGALQFGGSTAFTVSRHSGGPCKPDRDHRRYAVNSANYNVDTGAFTGSPITAGTEKDVIQNSGTGTYTSLPDVGG
jgi:6-phosphogluconolactonase (cycloisomerase 2 family)